jgi:putative membrane protein
MSRFIFISAASLAALSFAACGEKKDLATATTVPSETGALVTTADATPNIAKAQDFVNAAGQAGLVEIRTSELALEHSKNTDVKAFAQMMIEDHKAAAEKLKATALAVALAPPAEMLDDFHMRRINDLVESDGDADFDSDYMALQVDAHNDAIKLFEGYSKDAGTVSQLKSFADETLPQLNSHKAKAEQVRDVAKKATEKSKPS